MTTHQRQHDMGGMPAGPIDLTEHPAEPWAKLITSLRAAMGDHDLIVFLATVFPRFLSLGSSSLWLLLIKTAWHHFPQFGGRGLF